MGGLCRHRWRGSKFALKVSRGRNLRKDAGEESNLDRSSKGPQLGTRHGIATVGS